MGRAELKADADEALEKLGKAKDKRHGRASAEPGMESAAQRAQDDDPGILISMVQVCADMAIVIIFPPSLKFLFLLPRMMQVRPVRQSANLILCLRVLDPMTCLSSGAVADAKGAKGAYAMDDQST